MECPICGHRMGENDAFCPNCGNFALPMQDGGTPLRPVAVPDGTPSDGSALVDPPQELEQEPVSHPRKVAERLYPPPDETEESNDGSEEAPVKVRPVRQNKTGKRSRRVHRGWRIAAILCGVVTVAAAAMAIYVMVSTASLRVQLSKAQKENSSAQAAAASLETQVETLTEDLEEAKTDNESLGEQVAELQSQINEMETSVNQNQYDKESALTQLEEANTQLTTVTEERDALETELEETKTALEDAQSENEALTESNESLQGQVDNMTAEVEFYDTYVVFVMTANANRYYHKYDCPDFTKRNFVAYSTRLAEANGYTPCPICVGGGTDTNTGTGDGTNNP